MTNNKSKFIIYRMDYALEMQNRGHKIIGVLPNPQKPKLNCWVFETDETFSADFAELSGRRRKE